MPAQKPSRSKPPTKSQMVRATWSSPINCSTSTARQHICSRLILRIKGSLMPRAYPALFFCQLTSWVVFSQLRLLRKVGDDAACSPHLVFTPSLSACYPQKVRKENQNQDRSALG